ncbi:ATP-binding cassette domain-containing protein [Paenibacillus hexagrammi]|uniref:ATP-binding cassette domain-containing protein n=1 Tax=Paenibacillus hexagrammi TaxID=2908839 RepID=A0ABY3SKX5_9BACL|nr:ATP-binding cassette domain-containing protein [Paenibacillus sp. YPD9-1]UJF34035.1 ATP-binding cassette domain-containing protein [Paenibacillus sp. YPD9-1]
MSIRLHNVEVNAPDNKNKKLLKQMDITLEKGSITLLVGHTGSGKSTLLQVLAGIVEPDSGAIYLDEQPMWHKGKVAPSLLLRLGLTFQFPEQQLFARSVEQEFLYSLRPYRLSAEERERRIRAACAEFDPDGVFAMERSPFSLSGGQQRRLALATTFAAAPDWLLMDEPTAGMEAAAVGDLLRLIRRSERPMGGYVIATHDLDTFLPLADRVIVLAGGAVAADGTPEAVCRRPELLQAAGVGLPSCAEAAQALERIGGIVIPPDTLTPERAAAAIAEALRARTSAGAAAQPASMAALAGAGSPTWAAAACGSAALAAPAAAAPAASPGAANAQPHAAAPLSPPFEANAAIIADMPSATPDVFRAAPCAEASPSSPGPSNVQPSAADSSVLPRAASPLSSAGPSGAMPSTDTSPKSLGAASVQAEEDALPPRAAWHRVDPRAKWMLYVLLVIAAMLQHHWTGLAAAAVPVLLGFIGLPRMVIRGGVKVARSFVIFMIVSVALAGLQISFEPSPFTLGFDTQRAAETVLNVSRLLLVVVAGYWFAVTTPYGQMVQGLGWVLKYLKKVKIPVDSFALAVSLIFRFLPLILREWQRFSTIVRARGKASLRPGAVRMRDIPALVVPLLLSLFYKAEEMTMAMELKRMGGQPLTAQKHMLNWAKRDTVTVLAGVVCFILLAIWSGR